MSVMHVAMFRWMPTVTDDQISNFERALATMPAAVGCLKSFRFGRDLAERDGNFDFAVIGELEEPEQIHGYLDHPAHLRLVEEHLTTMLAERKAVQFALRAHQLVPATQSTPATTSAQEQ